MTGVQTCALPISVGIAGAGAALTGLLFVAVSINLERILSLPLVPGRAAPKLIPASAVEGMKPGAVIVDLAAEAGGNAESTEPGEVVERDGVTLVGLTNLASTMPLHASQLYARNVSALLQHLAPDGALALDWDDEITAGACVTREKVAA